MGRDRPILTTALLVVISDNSANHSPIRSMHATITPSEPPSHQAETITDDSYGFPAAPELFTGTPDQLAYHQRILAQKVEYMKKHDLPIWNGEFGPVYASPSDGSDWEKVNESRYGVLEYQLSLYREQGISWSIWLWKGESGFVCQAERVRYRLSGNGLRQPRYGLYEIDGTIPQEKEGEIGLIGIAVLVDVRNWHWTIGDATMRPSETFLRQSTNGC